jgi:hypothetical protein
MLVRVTELMEHTFCIPALWNVRSVLSTRETSSNITVLVTRIGWTYFTGTAVSYSSGISWQTDGHDKFCHVYYQIKCRTFSQSKYVVIMPYLQKFIFIATSEHNFKLNSTLHFVKQLCICHSYFPIKFKEMYI